MTLTRGFPRQMRRAETGTRVCTDTYASHVHVWVCVCVCVSCESKRERERERWREMEHAPSQPSTFPRSRMRGSGCVSPTCQPCASIIGRHAVRSHADVCVCVCGRSVAMRSLHSLPLFCCCCCLRKTKCQPCSPHSRVCAEPGLGLARLGLAFFRIVTNVCVCMPTRKFHLGACYLRIPCSISSRPSVRPSIHPSIHAGPVRCSVVDSRRLPASNPLPPCPFSSLQGPGSLYSMPLTSARFRGRRTSIGSFRKTKKKPLPRGTADNLTSTGRPVALPLGFDD
ncbi:hypothetical protein LX32DRAFT_322529 [Colletotrichum zoysiae]|uniref:Uncharacterized protein n=1 Tax=Colletotrichum zoysiae TaxID=1216348 RepID=A0AAD9H2U2_9PEZI|nr:hypothetical protein LX32DRAFT_322529 [Colletotrichum zoysiae]